MADARFRPFWRRLLRYFPIIAALASPTVWAACQPGKFAEFPVVADIDRKSTPIGMALRVPSHDYGQPYADFRGSARSNEDRQFVVLIDALKSRQPANLAGLATTVHELAGANSAAAFVELWSSSFDLNTLKVISKACVRDYHLYFWQVDTPKGPYVRQFSFLPASGANEKTTQQVLTVGRLARASLQAGLSKPASTAVKSAIASGRETPMRLVPDLSGRSAADYSVIVKSAAVTDLVNALERPPRVDPLVGIFDTAKSKLKAGDVKAFEAVLSETSQKKFSAWWEKLDVTGREGFNASLTDLQVAFDVTANPLRIIYFLENQHAIAFRDTVSRYRRKVISRDEAMTALMGLRFKIQELSVESGSPARMVNFAAQDFVYDFLTDPNGFVGQVVVPEILDIYSKS